MSKEITISDKQANFLFRNLFAHDPSHDFNPGSNTKRLAQLNGLFARLADNKSTSIFTPDSPGLVPFMEGGGIDDEIDPSLQDISLYEDFDSTDPFVALQNSEHFSETMKKLCLLANVDLNERNGPVTRSMTSQMRQLIEFVQQLVDYNNYLKVFVVSGDGEVSSLNVDENDMPIQTGGKLKQGNVDLLSVPEASLTDEDMVRTNLNKNIDPIEISTANKLIVPENASSEIKESVTSNVDPNFTSVFRAIQRELGNSSVDESLKSDVTYILQVLETTILFFHTYIDSSLPLYSVINSHFIDDALFICVIELMIFNSDNTYTRSDFASNTTLSNIYEIRKIKIDDDGQRGGGTKGTLKSLLTHFGTSIDIDNLINIEKNKLFESKDYILSNTLLEQIQTSMDEAIEKDILDENSKELNDKIYDILDKFYKKQYSKVSINLAKYHKAYVTNNDNVRKQNRIVHDFTVTLSQFYEQIIQTVYKQYKSNKDIISFYEEGATGKKMSAEGKAYANLLLTVLCRGILKHTRKEYVNMNKKKNTVDGFESLYEKERELIRNIAITTTTPSKLDSDLLVEFNKSIKDNKENLSAKNAVNILNGKYTKKPHIINNAMTTADDTKKRIVDRLASNGFDIICPISSILDAQGTMGSCRHGNASTGYISSPISIFVTGGKLEMNFELKPKGKKGNYLLEYYAIYDDLTISGCEVDATISNKILNILSASNTFKAILNHIELRFMKQGSADWSVFDSPEELANIARVASKKMMGDFLQELNAIVINGGFTKPQASYNDEILLTNGDQPSTVRSAFLLMHNNTSGDINEKAAVTFITPSQGYLYKRKLLRTGGKRTKTRRKATKQRRTAKRRKRITKSGKKKQSKTSRKHKKKTIKR
jgi:hypothetical protein